MGRKMFERDQFYNVGIQSVEKVSFYNKKKKIVCLPEDISNGQKIDMMVIWSDVHFT